VVAAAARSVLRAGLAAGRSGRSGRTGNTGDAFDVIFSSGSLDHFARWYGQNLVVSPRILAFGSTGVVVKEHSIDAAERYLARRLANAEQALFSAALARCASATVLRPTLVYGTGRDKTLTRIAGLA
jgi:hypothetical protein